MLRPLWRFFRFYVLRRGFAQGLAGLFVAQSAAFYVFARYAKLWEAVDAVRRDGGETCGAAGTERASHETPAADAQRTHDARHARLAAHGVPPDAAR